jgi:hypothetical protein
MIKKCYIINLVFIFSNLLFAQNAVALFDTTICKGSMIKLVSSKVGPYTYLWSTGETSESIFVSPTSTTTYTVESTFAGGVFIDQFKVDVDIPLPAPNIVFSLDRLISTYSPNTQIRWLKNNSILSGQSSDTLKFPLQGVYKSEVSSLGGCWTPSQLIYVSQDTDTAKRGFKTIVFPNPSSGYFNLLLDLPTRISKEVTIIVSDISGNKIFEKKQFIYQSTLVKIPITLPAGFKGQALLTTILNGMIDTQQVIVQ